MASAERSTAAGPAAVERVIRGFDRLLVLVGGAAAVVVLVVVGLTLATSVVLRYVSGSSLGFATELPSYLFPWLVTGGVVAAAGANGHLAVDFFVERIPPRARRVVTTAMWALVVFAFVNLTAASLRLIDAFTGQATPILGWPAAGSYLAFPAALAVLTVHSAGRAVAALLGLHVATGSPAGEGAVEADTLAPGELSTSAADRRPGATGPTGRDAS
jgi:TRAP-type transport system small permease protein